MNYWLLTTEYPPFHGGGISTYCYFTARMLADAGHSITVFVQDDAVPDLSASQTAQGITLVRFNSNRNDLHLALGYTARLSYAFADIVRTWIDTQGRPDIIEAQDYLGIAYYLTQFRHAGYPFLQNIPIVITLHSPAFLYLEYNRVSTYRFPDFWTGEMEKQAIAAADLLLSPTSFLAEAIGKYMQLDPQRLHILPNPYQPQQKLTPAHPIRFQRNRIVYYGKLSPQKGSFELLSYFRDLWDDGFEHPLHIIGGTDIVYHPEMVTMGQLVKERYEAYIEKGLLQLHGKITPDRIAQNLDDAHLIIVPSIVDNLPYVVMEAMSLGKVVLASVQGGQREMMEEGVSGFLFDHTVPGSFESQLKKILSLSDEEMQRIGMNACQRVEQSYSFEKIGQLKLQILQDPERQLIPGNYFPFLHQEPATFLPSETPETDLLSVVIPFYNMGGYIEECLDSVLSATWSRLEVLVIDDGSIDDNSLKKLDLIARKDKVRVIRQRNKGLAETRNEGARLAKGQYLAFLDSDDKVAPSYFEKAIHALKKNDNVFFAGSWVQYFGNSSRRWVTFTPQPPYVLAHNSVNSSGLVYKRAAFLAGGLNDKKVDYGLEDYESVIGMLHSGLNGIVLPELLFHYRVRSGSMFRQVTREKLLYSNKYISEKHADYYTKFAVHLVNLLNANGPGFIYDNPTFEVTVTSKMTGDSLFLLKVKSFVKQNEKLKKMVLALKKLKRL